MSVRSVLNNGVFELLLAEEVRIPVRVEMRYVQSDPWAVWFQFHATTDGHTDWTFARELLAAGLREPVGEGDVHIGPMPGDPDAVRIRFSSHEGQATLLAPVSVVSDFLGATYHVVSPAQAQSIVDEALEAFDWEPR